MLSRWTKTRFNFSLKLYSFEEMNFVLYSKPHQGTNLWDMRYEICFVFVLAIILIFAPKVKEFQHEFLIFITEVSSMLQNFKQFQRSPNTLSSRTQWLTKRLRISNEEIKSKFDQPKWFCQPFNLELNPGKYIIYSLCLQPIEQNLIHYPPLSFAWTRIISDNIFGDYPLSRFTFDIYLGTSFKRSTADGGFAKESVAIESGSRNKFELNSGGMSWTLSQNSTSNIFPLWKTICIFHCSGICIILFYPLPYKIWWQLRAFTGGSW